MGSESYVWVRFRHVTGDLGPYEINTKGGIASIKEKLFQGWPEDGPLAKDKPASPAEIRLICSGKYIDTTSHLKAALKHFDAPTKEMPITVHLIVRPPPVPAKVGGMKGIQEKNTSCCVIS